MTHPRNFDRFMVDNENGRNLKLMRLTDAEFRALVAGVWPIASKAEVRGAFMVGRAPATAEDVTHQSPKTTRKVAESLLAKMRELGMLEFDSDLGAEWVHDWDRLNPAPKTDATNAKRQAAWRARNAGSNATDNGGHNAEVTPIEVKKGLKEEPPNPQRGVGVAVVKYHGKTVPPARVADADAALAAFNAAAGTNYGAWSANGKPSPALRQIIGALLDHPDVDRDLAGDCCRVELKRSDPYWDTPHVGVVFGPAAFPRVLEAVRRKGTGPFRTNVADDLDRAYGRTAR